MSARRTIFGGVLLIVAFCLIFLGGCVDTRPILLPDVTLPLSTAAATPPSEQTSPPMEQLPITHLQDYGEYLLYKNIVVYEQEGHTLLDAMIVNEYPGTLVCVLDVYFTDEQGEVARGRLTDGSGQEVLYLSEGETRVYAQIQTDMSVTLLDLWFEPIGDPIVPLTSQDD